jgi:drug/metabolite transporter (DMT)-like permease
MKKNNNVGAYIALGVGVLSLSLSALFVRWSTAHGIVTSFYRMSLASLVMLPFLTRELKATKISRGLLLMPVLGGIFAALDHATWGTAIGLTRVANATLFNNTAPLWVGIFSWLVFRRKQKGAFWVGLALTMIGAVIVLRGSSLDNPEIGIGDMIALVSSLFYAAYYLVIENGRANLSTLAFTGIANVVSAFTLLAISLGFGLQMSGFPTETYLAFLGAALISQIGGHFSITYALGHLPAAVVSPTMVAQPVLTALLAIPLAGEPLQPLQWIGGAVVVAGIYSVNLSKAALHTA